MSAPIAPVTVTQADRSRAAWLHKELHPHMPQKWLTDLREGRCDSDRILVALARHRTATEAAFRAREAELREALNKAAARFDHCASMIEEGFNISGTLRAERRMKAQAYAQEARAALARAKPAEQGEG
jgi:hypothetical protein